MAPHRLLSKAVLSLLVALSTEYLCGRRRSPPLGALAFSSRSQNHGHISKELQSTCARNKNNPHWRSSILLSSTRDITDQSTISVATLNPPKSPRLIAKTEQFARLPIWPIWSGVLLFLTSRLSPSLAAIIEDSIGGRVCPNFFDAQQTSPFVLMVHHRHSFSILDPIRFIQQFVFPEGFPSHPHRGFVTVTFCLKGGMIHRDSLGIKQSYGAESRHDDAHVQWLTAGAGIQHEEMWDTDGNVWSDQELYQIWLNLPSGYKMTKPKVELLRRHFVKDEEEIPDRSTPIIDEDGTVTTVVCGEYGAISASIDCPTNAAILQVHFKKGAVWKHVMPKEHETAILYIRKGSVKIGLEIVPVHHTAYLTRDGEELVIESEGEADVLLLSGEPLREPIASQGSMVMNTQQEIQEAYMDYQRGFMGVPWSEKLSDEEWMEHVRRNPSKY